MKKIAIALMLAVLLTLCGCSSDTIIEEEGAAVRAAVSSDSGVGADTKTSDVQEAAAQTEEGETLPSVEDGYEAVEIELGSEGSTNSGAQTATTQKSSSGAATTTAASDNNNNNSGNGSEGDGETTTSDGIHMPRVPIPNP